MKKIFITLFLACFLFTAHSQKWVKVWSDEFNTPGLPDSTKWGYEIGLLRNQESQYYTNRSENARIEDTVLIIEARKEAFAGSKYTAASIKSRYTGDWKYGRIEVRAKIPTGKGTWPAIWMMPTDDEYGGWPRSGEIDIMENIGIDPSAIYSTVHFEGTNGTGHQSSGSRVLSNKPFDRFITYTVEWTADKIVWYNDNQKVHTYNRNSSTDYRVWPFNQKFYMILNLAIGGSWAGTQGIDDNIFPTKFLIDYVRVYQWQAAPGPFTVNVKSSEGGTVEIENAMTEYPEGTKIKLKATPNEGYVFEYWLNHSSANPYELEVNQNYEINALFFRKGEMLKNGNFDDNLKYWNNYYFNDSKIHKATSSVVDGEYVFNITQKGTDWWHIGDQQTNIAIKKGTTYRLSFDAYCETPALMGISLSKNHDDYGAYYTKTFNLTKAKVHYTWDITNTYPDDVNCRLYFGVGNFLGKVFLDNVSLVNTTITTIDQPELENCSVNVYPIPATQSLNVDLNLNTKSNVTLTLYNGNGSYVKSLYARNTVAGKHQLDLPLCEEFLPGLYFLMVKTDDAVIMKKIVIQ